MSGAGQQMALLNALVAANSSAKLVVVLIHGRPQTFGPDNAALAKVDALVAAWRPGEEAALPWPGCSSATCHPRAS